MTLLSVVTFLLYWIHLQMIQFCIDLHQQVSSCGMVFTKVVVDLQNYLLELLASHSNFNSLSPWTLLPEQQGCIAWIPKGASQAYRTIIRDRVCTFMVSIRDVRFTEFRIFNDTAALIEALAGTQILL